MWLVFEGDESCCISPQIVKLAGCKVCAGKCVQAVFLFSYGDSLCYLRNIRYMNALENTMNMCNALFGEQG